jgi:hypothetical protein
VAGRVGRRPGWGEFPRNVTPHPGLCFASAFPPHRFAGGGIRECAAICDSSAWRVTQSRLGGFNGCTISRNTGSASQRAVCALSAGQRAASNNCGWASRVNRSAQATAMSVWPIFSPNQRVGLSRSRNPSFRKLGFTGIASLRSIHLRIVAK